MRPKECKAAHGQITHEGVTGLTHGSLGVLQAHGEQREEAWLALVDEGLERHAKALNETREEIQGNNKEGFIGLIEVAVVLEGLILKECMVNKGGTAVEYRCGVGCE